MQKRYWLRFGLGLAVISLAYNLLQLWLDSAGVVVTPQLHRLIYEIGYPFNFVGFFSVGFNDSAQALVLGRLVAFVAFFLIGALAGWVYGKIKNRNQVQ